MINLQQQIYLLNVQNIYLAISKQLWTKGPCVWVMIQDKLGIPSAKWHWAKLV